MFWTEYNDTLKKKKKKKKKKYIYFYFLFFSVSLYSVQNIAIHRIQLIFDSSNTLVNRLGPNVHTPSSFVHSNKHSHGRHGFRMFLGVFRL